MFFNKYIPANKLLSKKEKRFTSKYENTKTMLLQRTHVASQLCEPTVFYDKHILANKLSSKKERKLTV